MAEICDCRSTAWAMTKCGAAIVDASHRPILQTGWGVQMRGDAPACLTRSIDGKTTRLHRLLMNAGVDVIIDHINGDPLDNRLANLRIATATENNRNKRRQKNATSGFKGVNRHKDQWWMAQIMVDGIRHRLGLHRTAEAAARAYDEAAKHHFGAHAKTNESMGMFSTRGKHFSGDERWRISFRPNLCNEKCKNINKINGGR